MALTRWPYRRRERLRLIYYAASSTGLAALWITIEALRSSVMFGVFSEDRLDCLLERGTVRFLSSLDVFPKIE